MIKTDDFRYMWRGQIEQILPKQDAYRLAPVVIEKQKHDRALLLLHGFSSTPAVYRLMIPKLTSYDGILCPVLPGHGETIEAFSLAKAKDWLRATEHAYQQLKKTYAQVDVMGISLGGLLGCHLAKNHPIHHLYLLNPALALKTSRKASLGLTHILHALGLSTIPNRAGNLHTREHFELTYRKLPLATIIEILTLIGTPVDLPRCPTDLFLGVFDKVVDVKKVSEIFKGLPNIHTHWLHNSAHVLPLDGDVEEILQCVNQNNHDLMA
ncbi:MAG: alpha/beta hydrolase [Legionellaceae bacterium]